MVGLGARATSVRPGGRQRHEIASASGHETPANVPVLASRADSLLTCDSTQTTRKLISRHLKPFDGFEHRDDQRHEADRQQPEQVEPSAADAHPRRYSVHSRDRARPGRRVDHVLAGRDLPAVAADEVGRDARLRGRRGVFRRRGGGGSQDPESTKAQRAVGFRGVLPNRARAPSAAFASPLSVAMRPASARSDGQAALAAAIVEPTPCLVRSGTLWWRCHRRLIAELLQARRNRVVHLLGPASSRSTSRCSMPSHEGRLYLCGALVAQKARAAQRSSARGGCRRSEPNPKRALPAPSASAGLGALAAGEAAAALGVGRGVVELVVVVEGRLLGAGELVALQLDVRARS